MSALRVLASAQMLMAVKEVFATPRKDSYSFSLCTSVSIDISNTRETHEGTIGKYAKTSSKNLEARILNLLSCVPALTYAAVTGLSSPLKQILCLPPTFFTSIATKSYRLPSSFITTSSSVSFTQSWSVHCRSTKGVSSILTASTTLCYFPCIGHGLLLKHCGYT